MITCPKCNYVRQPSDLSPETECPRCGVIDAKAKSRVSNTPIEPPPAPLKEIALNDSPAAHSVRSNKIFESGISFIRQIIWCVLCSFEALHGLIQRSVSTKEPKFVSANMVACEVCGNHSSVKSPHCTKCGHPNKYAPNIREIIAGVVAILVAIASLFMPYFISVFFVPVAFVAAVIAAILRSWVLALIAVLIASVGAYGIYTTSQKMKNLQSDFNREHRNFERELRNFEKQLNR